jgi:MFS family permease
MLPQHPGRWSLTAVFVTLGISYGIWYAYSVFLVALLREFGWSRSVLAGAFSLFALVHGGLSPALGWLADRIGARRLILLGAVVLSLALALDSTVNRPWQLYLAFGLLTAIGVAGAGWVPAVVLVSGWFPDRRGLALGIAGSGIGMGIFLVVPLCQVLIEGLGWRWAFRALGALALLWMLPTTLFVVRDPPGAPAAARAGTRGGGRPAASAPAAGLSGEQTLMGAVAARTFWLIAAAQVFGSFCTQSLFVHQAAYLTDQGLPALVAAAVVSIVGLASIFGKTGGGWLSDSLGRETVYLFGMLCMIASVGVLFLVSIGARREHCLSLRGPDRGRLLCDRLPDPGRDRRPISRPPVRVDLRDAPGCQRPRRLAGPVGGRADLRRDWQLPGGAGDRGGLGGACHRGDVESPPDLAGGWACESVTYNAPLRAGLDTAARHGLPVAGRGWWATMPAGTPSTNSSLTNPLAQALLAGGRPGRPATGRRDHRGSSPRAEREGARWGRRSRCWGHC